MLNPRRFYFAVGKKRFIEFIIFSIFLLIFYGPLMNTFMLAFANVYQFPDVIPREFGLQWWDFILSQQNLIDSIANSFLIAFLSTFLSLLICLPAAYALARFDFKGKKIIMFSFLFSNAFPKIGLYTSIGILFYRMNLMGTFQGVLIDQYKSVYTRLKEEFFNVPISKQIELMGSVKTLVEEMARVTGLFSDAFQNHKYDRRLLDFNDLEHLTFQILTKKSDDGTIGPSEASDYYRSCFKEVMVDEYQDINFLQESLLKWLTSDSKTQGNQLINYSELLYLLLV